MPRRKDVEIMIKVKIWKSKFCNGCPLLTNTKKYGPYCLLFGIGLEREIASYVLRPNKCKRKNKIQRSQCLNLKKK